MLRQKKKVEADDEFDEDDEEQEDDSLEDEPRKTAVREIPKPTMFNKPSEPATHHVAGEMTTELMELGNGTFRPVKRVWMNSKESAVSDDPLLVLLCQKLFPQLDNSKE